MNPTKVAFFKETQKATDAEIKHIRKLDPTSNCDNAAWLLRGIRAKWFGDTETKDIQNALLSFARLKSSPKLKEAGISNDLNRYECFNDLRKVTDNYWDYLSNKQKNKEFRGAELVYHEGPWKMYRVFEVAAAMQLSSGSNWCTTQEHQAVSYLGKSNLWTILFYDKPYCQMHLETGQCQDRKNQNFYSNRGDVKFLMDYHVGRILHLHLQYTDIQEFLRNYSPVLEPNDTFYEAMKYKSREVVMAHLSFFQKRVPEIEDFLEADFTPENENNLLLYLSHFDKPEEFEPYIKNSAIKAWAYAISFKKALPKEKEGLLEGTDYFIPYLNRFGDVANYKFTTIDTVSRWIKDNPQVRNETAEKILLGRMEKFDAQGLIRYSRLAVKGRWEELEANATFRRSPSYFLAYGKEFSAAPVPVAEVVETWNGVTPDLFDYIFINGTEEEIDRAFARTVSDKDNWSTRYEGLKFYIGALNTNKKASPVLEDYLAKLDSKRVQEGLDTIGDPLKLYFKNQTLNPNLCLIAMNKDYLQMALLESLKARSDLFEEYLGRYDKKTAQAYITKYSVMDTKLMLTTLDLSERFDYAIKNGIRLPEEDEKRVQIWKRMGAYSEKCLQVGERSMPFEELILQYLDMGNESSVKAFKTYAKRAWAKVIKTKTKTLSKMMVPDTFEKRQDLVDLVVSAEDRKFKREELELAGAVRM